MYRLFISIAISFTAAFPSQKIYLIHGFCSIPLSMVRIKKELLKRGYTVENYGYRSVRNDLEILGKRLHREIAALPEDSVSFITHSMGALVVRSMCRHLDSSDRFPFIHRFIMIAPPNRGAEIADYLSSSKAISVLLGPNLGKMRTDSGSYANSLPLPKCEKTGTIVGIGKKGFWFDRRVSRLSDGYLTPGRALLGIETDIAFVNESHNLISMRSRVVELVVRFFEHGSFAEKAW